MTRNPFVRQPDEPQLDPTVIRDLEVILASPASKALLAEAEAPVLAQRRAWLGEIAVLEDEWRDRRPALEAAAAAATARRADAEAALERARADEGAALGARFAGALASRNAIAALETRLRQTATDVITEFRGELARLEDECLAQPIHVVSWINRPTAWNWGRRPETDTASNAGAIAARLDAIRVAREELARLEYAAITSAELDEQLIRLRSSIPARATLERAAWASDGKPAGATS